jgi:uncharacterized membrane protein
MDVLSQLRAGEKADPASFDSAMIHFYRGEMQRMTVWRTRLDTTSNWAILLTTGMTTFTLGSQSIPHFILLLGLALLGTCILIEARRYRHLLHSKWRLYMVEANYFGQKLLPDSPPPDVNWRKHLADDLADPRLRHTLFCALRLRLRRNYLLLVYFVTAVWLTKVFIHPQSPESLLDYHSRLAVGGLFPSWFVAVTAGVFVGGCTILAATCPSEERLDLMTVREAVSRPPADSSGPGMPA